MEERHKNEQLESTIADLKQQLAAQTYSQGSAASTCTSATTQVACNPDVQIEHNDSKGQTWHQPAHHCSRHGYNHDHDNAGCQGKHKPIDPKHQQWQNPWQQGATHSDHKGGGAANQEKFVH